jgi:hypothetical protein
MTGHSTAASLVVAAFTLATLAVPAHADAIDGQWCDRTGRSLKIEGPNIATPGGTAMTGDYDRHAFAYVVPAGEAGAGQTVEMILLGDDDLDLTVGPAGGARSRPERWRRCNVTS